jgi:hypothetical protein
VAWAHGTSGVASRCAPSLVADGNVSRVPELTQLLAAGTVVTATDYPGLGVAAMAPPTDLADLLERDKNEAAGIVLTALALTSWKAWYPDVDLRTVVYPGVEPLVERVGKRCVLTTEEGIRDTADVLALKVRFLSANPSDAPAWSTHLAENRPTSVPASIPLLVSQGLSDTLVRPDVTEAFVQQQCAAGATIEPQS